MSQPHIAQPAKLVIGSLVSNKKLFREVALDLTQLFGAMDMISGWMDFDYTNYYAKEMGKPLYRRMVAFKRLISQQDIAHIKLETNALEERFSISGKRQVNIDPGYMLYERFVLATGKNFTHRIYIGSGIYADLTLIFQKGAFQRLPWTYPDYSNADMMTFLKQVRDKYGVGLHAHHDKVQ
jgi:hypothetical protein